jgi:xylulokinase
MTCHDLTFFRKLARYAKKWNPNGTYQTSSTMHFLGIDVGTGGSRAVLIDSAGQIVASETVEHIPFASPRTGWAEQDPDDWWRASVAAIRAVLSHEGVSSQSITAIGLSGQMHGAVLLDADDKVLRPSIIWCDQRSDVQCRELTEQIGASRLIELTCNPALTGFTLPKILWVKDHAPEHWRRIRSVLLPKDYVRLRLTGDKATDVADASGTLLLDVRARRWSNEMLDAAGLKETVLPELFEAQEITGSVSQSAAKLTGLRPGTSVVAGAGDQAAGAVGMGIVKPGSVSATIGTSGVVFAATNHPALDPKGRVHTFCHAIPNRWHVMGVTQGAGLSLRWFRDQFDLEPYDLLTAEAANVPPGANNLLWAPYLMGERTPHLDPNARAALVGLTASHTRAHVVRAILEGVAFSLLDSMEILREMNVPVESIRLGGGGARSKLWRQIQADVYGHAVDIIEAEEGAAYGAALLAGVGGNHWKSVDDACAEVVRVVDRIEPDAAAVKVLATLYRSYRELYPALRKVFNA